MDLIIESADILWAIEIKSSPLVKSGNLKGLKSFFKDHSNARPVCVSSCDTPYFAGEIPVIPWKFLFDEDYLNRKSKRPFPERADESIGHYKLIQKIFAIKKTPGRLTIGFLFRLYELNP